MVEGMLKRKILSYNSGEMNSGYLYCHTYRMVKLLFVDKRSNLKINRIYTNIVDQVKELMIIPL